MTIRKTVKNWAEMSLNVVDFKIFRFQLELCFAPCFSFHLNIVLKNYSPEYSVTPGAKEAMKQMQLVLIKWPIFTLLLCLCAPPS